MQHELPCHASCSAPNKPAPLAAVLPLPALSSSILSTMGPRRIGVLRLLLGGACMLKW